MASTLYNSLFMIGPDITPLDSSVMGIWGLDLSADICSAFATGFGVAVSTLLTCINGTADACASRAS